MNIGVASFVLETLDGTIFVVNRGLDRETSSSMAALLRLLESKYDGSMFSESESSGEAALLFRLDVELGVMAVSLEMVLLLGWASSPF